MEFDHVGIPASAKRQGMRYLESKRLWLTSPSDHDYRVEWLWYEEGSPEAELVRTVLSQNTSDTNREDDPKYIVRLVGQIIRVSVETAKIVKAPGGLRRHCGA